MRRSIFLFLATSAGITALSSVYISNGFPSRHRHCSLRPDLPPSSSRLHYKVPNEDAGRVWSVLARTERWICDTLDRSNRAESARLDAAEEERDRKKMHFAEEAAPPLPRADNPYARKEVSYVCETSKEAAAVVGGLFRRVREARELGERHGETAEARRGDASFARTTMRQTNLVVLPNCDDLGRFDTFDKLMKAVNQARRTARDYVLKPEEEEEEEGQCKDWAVSINCAHLHPEYGTLSPTEQIAALRREEAKGEVDVNLEEYKRSRDAARRSPYPSVIVEVRSTPPTDFGARDEATEAAASMEAAALDAMEVRSKDATSEDVRKLEALFGRSAATRSADDPFYSALGEAFGDTQISPRTPLRLAQDWVLRHDPGFDDRTSAFTESDTRHVDAAYEYVFQNLAMLAQDVTAKHGQKSYVVLPNFAPTSATSLDRFAGQVSNIVQAMPGLADRVLVSTFHPEHVAESTRAPVPIIVLTWK